MLGLASVLVHLTNATCLLGPFQPTKNGGMAPVLTKESEKVQTRMGTISVENPKG